MKRVRLCYTTIMMTSTQADQLMSLKYGLLTIASSLHFSKVKETRMMPK